MAFPIAETPTITACCSRARQTTNGTAAPIRGPVRLAVAEAGEAAPSAAFLDQLSRSNGLVLQAVGIPMPGLRMAPIRAGPNGRPSQACATASRPRKTFPAPWVRIIYCWLAGALTPAPPTPPFPFWI